jgi:hypothetical protein
MACQLSMRGGEFPAYKKSVIGRDDRCAGDFPEMRPNVSGSKKTIGRLAASGGGRNMHFDRIGAKFAATLFFAFAAIRLALLAASAHAQSVAALAFNPSVITGARNGSAIPTVTVDAAAPTGGSIFCAELFRDARIFT